MVTFNRTDLDYILDQIRLAEDGQVPSNTQLAFGLREVAGTNNNLLPGQSEFGSVDQPLPRVGAPVFRTVQQMSLIDAFTNPLGYLTQGVDAAGNIVMGTTGQVANEIDEFVTGALRNNLLGLPLDLAAINIARGRDTGVPPLNVLRNQLFTQTGDSNLKPYDNWAEFGQFLKHAASLINFVAAYGTHASILAATTLEEKRAAALELVVAGLDEANIGTDAWDFMHSLGAYANDVDNLIAVHGEWSTGSVTGLDNVDLWIGGLAEKQILFGSLLGSTFQFIFETQLEALQDGDRLYYCPASRASTSVTRSKATRSPR